jgi:predicted DNA-binding protein (MmcQ/YjbR family)
MEIDEILDYASSLPDTEEATPFGPDTVVIKHHGKLFIILNLSKETLSFLNSASKSKFLLCKRARIFLLFSDSERIFSFY